MKHTYHIADAHRYSHGSQVATVIVRETSGSSITEYELDAEDGRLLETVNYSTRPARVYWTNPRNPEEEPRPYIRRHNQRIHLDNLETRDYGRRAGTAAYVAAYATTYFSAYLLLATPSYDGETARIAYSYS
jgi:hypothetical protein